MQKFAGVFWHLSCALCFVCIADIAPTRPANNIRSSFAVPYYSLRIYTVLEVSTVALYLLSECIYAYMAYMHA